MELKCVWEFRPTRVVLLGTTDPGSVLYRLPKSDGVMNIILGFVVLYYEEEVLAQRVLGELIRDNVCAGPQGQSVQESAARQPDAVADGARGVLCARPRERNQGYCKYCLLQCGLFWSNLQLMTCQVFCTVLCVCESPLVTNEIKKHSAEIRCAVWR